MRVLLIAVRTFIALECYICIIMLLGEEEYGTAHIGADADKDQPVLPSRDLNWVLEELTRFSHQPPGDLMYEGSRYEFHRVYGDNLDTVDRSCKYGIQLYQNMLVIIEIDGVHSSISQVCDIDRFTVVDIAESKVYFASSGRR